MLIFRPLKGRGTINNGSTLRIKSLRASCHESKGFGAANQLPSSKHICRMIRNLNSLKGVI